MIEIINIFFLIFSMIWIYSFPLLQSNLKNNSVINKFTPLEKISVNLSIFLNFFLILSFYKVNFQYIFIILLILPLINFFFLKKKIILQDLIILLFFSFVLSISISSNLKLEWDGAAIWIYKTINFFSGNNFNNLSEIPGAITYPHLGSYIWAFFWKNSFVNAEYSGRIFYIFCFCLSILLIVGLLKNKLLNKILLISATLIISLDYYLFAGYQEYLVFSTLIFIFYFYFKYFYRKEKIFLVPIILFINSILWIKNEASFFVLFLFLFIFTHHLVSKNKIKKEIILIGIFFIFTLLIKNLIFYISFNELNTGWYGYEINEIGVIFSIDYIFERTSSIITNIVVALIKCKIYLIFFLTMLFFYSKENLRILLPFVFFLLLNLILIFFIYFLTNDPNWRTYQATTIDRLLMQTSGVYLFPVYFILKKKFKLQ
jgi:hypothetical protein